MKTLEITAKAKQISDLKKQSALMLQRIRAARLSDRFLLGSQTETRLRKSLASVDRLDLLTSTLLCPAVHVAHAEKLGDRFIALWERVKAKSRTDWLKIPNDLRRGTAAPTDVEIANKHLRFFTLIDSVTVVDADAALQAALRMKAELAFAVANVPGTHCLGAIEAEVISLPVMRRVRDLAADAASEKRKLSVCEELAVEFQGTLYQDETHLFLVHFHGLVTSNDERHFESLRQVLLTNSRWSKAPRQIEIKRLSEEFNGKPKTVHQNLKHIANYITKGGNDWEGKAIALRYKIGFSQSEDYIDEFDYAQKHWRRCETLRAEHKLDGIEDALSMTVYEIAQLAIFIDKLMASNRTRTGYLISAGK
jgi:hypothetical protein